MTGVYDIRNSYERGRPEIKLNIKPEAETLGLTLADLAIPGTCRILWRRGSACATRPGRGKGHGAFPQGRA